MKTNNRFKNVKAIVLALCLVLGFQICSTPLVAYAAGATEESGSNYDISWIGGEGNGAFAEMEKMVQETGNSAFNLFMAIGIVGILLSLILCGLGIAFSGGGQNRSQKLGWLLWIGLGGIVIFGATSIIGVLQSIGGNII